MDDKEAVVGVKIEYETFWQDAEITTKASSYLQNVWKPDVTVNDMASAYKNIQPATLGYDKGNRLFQRTSLYNLRSGHNNTFGAQRVNLFYGWERIYEVTQRGYWDMSMYPFDQREIKILMPLTAIYGADSIEFVTFKPFNAASSCDNSMLACDVHSRVMDLGAAAVSSPGYMYTSKLVSEVLGRTKIPGDFTGEEYTLVAKYKVDTCKDDMMSQCIYEDKAYVGEQMQGRSQCRGNPLSGNGQTCLTPTIKLEMKLTRIGLYTFLAKMLPVSLCSFAAYAGVWTPISTAMPRFAASIIPFLTAANIMNGVTAALPTSAFGCYIILWLVIQLVILCALVVDTMIMFRFYKQLSDLKSAPIALATINHYDQIPQTGYPVFFFFSWFWAYVMSQGNKAPLPLIIVCMITVILTLGGFLAFAYYIVFMVHPKGAPAGVVEEEVTKNAAKVMPFEDEPLQVAQVAPPIDDIAEPEDPDDAM